VASVIAGGTGVYNVTWNRSVATCGYMVSPVIIGGAPAGAVMGAAENSGASVVTVRTWDSFGNALASGFTVSVICP
jgi:hypothetical protein